MNVGLHHRAERIVDTPVPRQWRQSGKGLADHFHGKMPASVTRALMAGMFVTVVNNLQRCRRQCLQGRAHLFDAQAVVDQGSTSLNGFTSTLAYTPAPI